jgi:hypothetical protein
MFRTSSPNGDRSILGDISKQMESLMKFFQHENRFDLKPAGPRSLFSTSLTILLLLAIAAVTIASMGKDPRVGGNLILAPGQPGLEPAVY